MEGIVEDTLPRGRLRCIGGGWGLSPDEDARVVGCGGEDCAVLGMSLSIAQHCKGSRYGCPQTMAETLTARWKTYPRDTPHRAVVSAESVGQLVRGIVYLEYLDGFIGGTCREAPAVVIGDCIVLRYE